MGASQHISGNEEKGSAVDSIAHHTRFVRFSKHILLLLVVALVTGVIIVPLMNKEDAGIRVVFSSVERTGNPIAPRMIRPRLQGVDSDNHPFLVTAEEAIQPSEEWVELYRLKADFMLNGDSWLALNADKAEVDMLNKQMKLQGSVAIFYDSGYELRTEEARVDMDKSVAYGNVKVTGHGPAGVLQAGGFRVYDKGDRVRFTDGVKLTI